jgi:tetratricopeptide (TPR) repeat protein
MGRYGVADWIFFVFLALLGFLAWLTGQLAFVILLVILVGLAVRQYAGQPREQQKVQRFVNEAQAARDVGDVRAAIALYDQAIALQPKNLELYFEAGQVKLTENDYVGALGYFNRAVRLDPGYVLGHFMASVCHCHLENYRKALAINNQIINASPDERRAFLGYLGRGNVFISLQKFDRAEMDLEKAERLNPGFSLTQCALAEVFCHTGRFAEGLAAAEQAIKLSGALIQAYVCRSWALYELGNYDEALQGCNYVLQQEPKNLRAYEGRGLVHKGMGNLELALADLERALAGYQEAKQDEAVTRIEASLAEVRQGLAQGATDSE